MASMGIMTAPPALPGGKKLVCRVCQKAFSKAEHLRRHERCHTGSKPYICKECRRPFARQDALTRHEKLHVRAINAKNDYSEAHLPPQPTSFNSLPSWDTRSASTVDPVSTSATSHSLEESHSGDHASMHNVDSELDFALVWPDSENLFQSLMSSDTTDWQIPLGTLPFPPVVQDMNGMDFGSPNSFDDRRSSVGAILSGGGHQAVRDVTEMVTSSSSSVTAAVKSMSITSVFLDECLHMFFARFIPTFPILHRATFVFRECTHALLLNAIAIGSLYLGPKDSVLKGEALWHLAHTAISTSWQSLITHNGPYDACKGVQLMITALLGQIYGALSKNRAIRTTSQVFHPLGFLWARHCGMYDSEPYSMDNLPSMDAPAAEKEHQWRIWAAREIQQRTLLAYYVLDGLVDQTSSDGASSRHVGNPLTLPSSEEAFDAGTADEWLAHMHPQEPDQSSFRTIFRSLFPPVGSFRTLEYHFSAFALRVVLEGLQSLISDFDDNELAVGVPSQSDVRRALAQVHETISMSIHFTAAERLEILLRWHTVCLDTMINSTVLSRHVCSRYNIIQHISGGCGTVRPGFDLIKWANSEDARRAVLHAVAIQDIVEQLPRGRAHVVHMPSSLFAAATIYVVLSLAGVATVNLPRNIVWQDALLSHSDLNLGDEDIRPRSGSETKRFVENGNSSSSLPLPIGGVVRNLLYELNSMQKLFRCLSSQWGIAHDMEDIIAQWIQLCH
ncbi:transcriptional regulator family: Fungal Specific TF and C2H2 zinc finger [Penicillium roqueforti]|nr:transcriptional regulator family: Fungal Specific TF and C2H2 zinc finger [Penicillium roqueforti]KAI3114440.1 transcriptional regulator family: Fungal Specific TF and C2H2 zinc finger [Penicillium roqueforti]